MNRPHRIETAMVHRVRRILTAYRPRPVAVVPTHGDYQPRNWLMDEGTVRVIDFGRFAWRPVHTDWCRLAAQQWQGRPDLEEAFIAGYGSAPEPELWRIEMVRQAVSTSVWAYQEGLAAFEAQGHRVLARALDAYS
ncbi:phosphotransferase [Cellulosimicrobium funkei]|nr:phosphotransferase [Cellulosimicrobium funkei]